MKKIKKMFVFCMFSMLILGLTGCANSWYDETEDTVEKPVKADKTVLIRTLDDAETAKTGVAVSARADEVDTGSYWVTAATLGTLETAITKAKKIALKDAVTQSEADTAVEGLKGAITAFKGAKKAGTKTQKVETPGNIKVLEKNAQIYTSIKDNKKYTGDGNITIWDGSTHMTVGTIRQGKLTLSFPEKAPGNTKLFNLTPTGFISSTSSPEAIKYGVYTLQFDQEVSSLVLQKSTAAERDWIEYWYFETDANIDLTVVNKKETPEETSDSYRITAKKGWNRIYCHWVAFSYCRRTTDLSKLPSDLQWELQENFAYTE
jgi:hypothetical protein